MKFIIHSETPAKKNSRITLPNGKTIPSAKYREWHKSAKEEIELQLLMGRGPKNPIDFPVQINFNFMHSDKRRRDSDNQVSSILDLFQDCGILADDNWQIVQKIFVNNLLGSEANCEVEIIKL